MQKAVSLDAACRQQKRSFLWARSSYGGRLLSLFCDPAEEEEEDQEEEEEGGDDGEDAEGKFPSWAN